MTAGLADEWAQKFIDAKKLAAGNNPLDIGSWTDFKAALDASFIDPNKQRNAQMALENLHQGRMTAEEFFTQFDQTRRTAGYDTGHDGYLISLLERALNPKLVQDMYVGGIPSTYALYRERATVQDGYQQRSRAVIRLSQRFSLDHSTAQNTAGRNVSDGGQRLTKRKKDKAKSSSGNYESFRPKLVLPQALPSHAQARQTSGQTYGGAGQPMEIDRQRTDVTCHECGRKGHLRRNCPRLAGPSQQQNVRTQQQVLPPAMPQVPNQKGKGRTTSTSHGRQRIDVRAMLDQMEGDQQQELIDELVKRMGE